MQISLYSHNKRINSTSIPSGYGNTFECTLKMPTDWRTPSVDLIGVVNDQYNYAYINGNYFYVLRYEQITSDIIRIHLSKDTPASYRSQIMGSTQYCERSSVTYNGKLIDNFYPAEYELVQYRQTESMGFSTAGTYILGIAGKDGVNYYTMTSTFFAQFCNTVFSGGQETWWEAIVEAISDWATKNFIDPFSYVVSCKWIPFAISGSLMAIQCGYWSLDASGGRIEKNYQEPISLSFPVLANIGQNEYQNSQPYRDFNLFIPGVGDMRLDADVVEMATSVEVSLNVDLHGRILGTVSTSNGDILCRCDGNVAVEVALSSSTANIGGMASAIGGIATGVVGVASGGAGIVAGSLMAAGGVLSGLDSVSPKVTTKGGQGSFALPVQYPNAILHVNQRVLSAKNNDLFGSPCYQDLALNTAGYYQISRPVIPWGYRDEKIELENMMRGGIYIE